MIVGLFLSPLCGLSALVADCPTLNGASIQHSEQTIPAILAGPVRLTAYPEVSGPTASKTSDATMVNVTIDISGADGNVRADGTDPCRVRWGNTPVTSDELLERGGNHLVSLLTEVGGVENLTEENFPKVQIRGDASTPYRCIGGAIYTMRYAGFQKIELISQPEAGIVTIDLLVPLPFEDVPTVRNRIFIAASGVVTWNGRATDDSHLAQNLTSTAALQPAPELLLEPDRNAPYDTVINVLKIIERSGISLPGVVGNERYGREF